MNKAQRFDTKNFLPFAPVLRGEGSKNLFVIENAILKLSKSPTPTGVTANSRGSSEATPPESVESQ